MTWIWRGWSGISSWWHPETARDALLQTANLLTTIHAHLVSAVAMAATRARGDSSGVQLLRNLEEARKTADAASSVAAGFFDSAYASRDAAPALIDSGIQEASGIAARISHAEAANKAVDFIPFETRRPIQGLSGIDFLLMMVPVIGAALTLAECEYDGVHPRPASGATRRRIEGPPAAQPSLD